MSGGPQCVEWEQHLTFCWNCFKRLQYTHAHTHTEQFSLIGKFLVAFPSCSVPSLNFLVFYLVCVRVWVIFLFSAPPPLTQVHHVKRSPEIVCNIKALTWERASRSAAHWNPHDTEVTVCSSSQPEEVWVSDVIVSVMDVCVIERHSEVVFFIMWPYLFETYLM